MERCKCPAPATDMAIGHLVRKPNLVALKLRAMEFADKKLPFDVAIAAVTKTSLHFFALFCIGGSQGISPNPVFFSEKKSSQIQDWMRCMYNGQVSTRLHQTQSCNHLRAAPKTMALDSTTTLFGHCWALLGIAGYCWAFRPNTIRCKVHGPIWCVEGLFENSHSLNHSKQVLSNFVLAIGPRRPE